MEVEFHRWLREHVPANPNSPLGLNDDAAVLKRAGPPDLVVTTDLLSDGVDFRLAEVDPRRVGRKALAVSLSDLAAMAARPLAAFVSIALPRNGSGSRTAFELAVALYEGLLPLAAEFDVAIAGGDTNTHEGPLVVSVTAIGQVTDLRPLTRSGGKSGDKLLVTGSLGGSILGHHLDFEPRVRECLLLRERYELHAGLDISDGLALDASHLAAASGCGALIYTDKLPVSDSAMALAKKECVIAAVVSAAATEHALGDGEDFELLLATAPRVADAIVDQQPLDCPITCIGELIAERGLWQSTDDGKRTLLEPKGWQH
jgi:thiamine-monophosphate kinase